MDFKNLQQPVEIGIYIIDAQHKRLIDKVRELYINIQTENTINLLELLNSLLDYANHHFGAEETYFNKFDYKEKSAHIEEHKKFIEYIQNIVDTIEENDTIKLLGIVTFLNSWICKHINEVDVKYVAFLKSKS